MATCENCGSEIKPIYQDKINKKTGHSFRWVHIRNFGNCTNPTPKDGTKIKILTGHHAGKMSKAKEGRK